MAAPLNNLHAARTGRSIRLIAGELPKGLARQSTNVRKYRRGLEQAIMEVHGEIDMLAAHYVEEATRAEMHAAVCRWLMRTRLDKMSPSDIARCSAEILKAKTIRNKAIEKLKLNTIKTVDLASYINENQEA